MEKAQQQTAGRSAARPAAAQAVQRRPTAQGCGPVAVQCSLKLSSPGDPAEREAEAWAGKVARSAPKNGAGPARTEAAGAWGQARTGATVSPARLVSPYLARFAGSQAQVAPIAHPADPAKGGATAGLGVSAAIRATTGGLPLPPATRRFMESSFQADFGAIRIHADDRAARLNTELQARAFTVGRHIFLSRNSFRPESDAGKELLAHELTHTIQQGAAVQVRRSALPAVSVAGVPAVQRLGVGDALDFFARHAEDIPGFRLLTLVLGRNPINMRAVDRSPGNLLRAAVELMPGGAMLIRALDNHGLIDRAAGWVQQRFGELGLAAGSIRQAIDRFLGSLGWTDIFNLGGVWERARYLVAEPIARIAALTGNLAAGVLQLIREAIVRPLAGLARGTRGWDLLCAVLGRDPISNDAVPRTAETLLGGFMRLIGQEEIWRNLQRANAVNRAFAWFAGALEELRGQVVALPQLVLDTLRGLGIADLLSLPQTFARIGRLFGSFLAGFVTWAGRQVWALLEIVFDVVAPAAMPYLRRAAAAFRTIVADPARFVGNLVRAAAQGLRQFAANVVTHLRGAVVGWLTGTLAGANIYIPKAFTLREIVKFVCSVLGLTWHSIRAKLVRAVGEPAVAAMERGFDFVAALVREGPAAAWERIRESLTNLRELVMEQVLNFVRTKIVVAAVTRLVAMLNPAGAFIQAIVAIYNTIMFLVERMRQIAQVGAACIDSLAAIAGGAIEAAANRVEQTMAGLLTLVISFLARQAGLGRVSDAIVDIINKIRQPVDRALDRVVDWIVRQGRRFLGAAREAAGRAAGWWRRRKPFRTAGGASHEVYFVGDERNPQAMVASQDPCPIPDRLDQFARMAREPKASKKQRDSLNIIDATRKALARNPDDPIIVVNLRELFGVFEKTVHRNHEYKQKFGTIGGDPTGTTVGTWMRIARLNRAFVGSHPGSEPQSGAQKPLMDLLETDPGQKSPGKYIKGHLLNHRLGGIGNQENMFPITGNANSQHYHSIEKRVIDWVVKGSEENWATYEVEVKNAKADIETKRPVWYNWVNATLQCRATLKDGDNQDKDTIGATVTSEYLVRHEAERTKGELR
ncbi:DUF4157 domain-containing protein [Desulfobulbus sp.]|uniref:DUF4157 domain-containing protein n=1 Tax=Desulfobulbus sp. TaxID=895 RepID=UPI00286F565F|nr:DUF4157 domain-containing protein [Desulfobulbus sp.]